MRPRYQDIPAARIPNAKTDDGRVSVKVIAGEALGAKAVIDVRTPIVYLHFTLQPGGEIVQPVPAGFNALVYVVGGEVRVGDDQRIVSEGEMAILTEGDSIRLGKNAADKSAADVLLLAGLPLREPVARYGPFVMNTQEEISQAMTDYRAGKMGTIPADIG